jgi:sulfite exporter TauE/SafE
MKLQFVVAAFAAFFGIAGLALATIGIGIFRTRPVAGITAFAAGTVLVGYAVRLTLHARRRRFPEWIRDIPHSAPL